MGDPILTIRPYVDADTDAVMTIFRSAVRQTARRDYSLEQVTAWAPDDADRAGWAQRSAARGTWIATVGGTPAGFSDLGPDGYVDMLFVHPDFGGRGVARALLAHVEGLARARGLALMYTDGSLTARPVFERAGFLVIQAQDVVKRGITFRNFRMEKRLPPPDEGALPAGGPAG
ncbi:MAG: GNAT family N-acetyltransferase [Alphaproteobacteria bacterium]